MNFHLFYQQVYSTCEYSGFGGVPRPCISCVIGGVILPCSVCLAAIQQLSQHQNDTLIYNT